MEVGDAYRHVLWECERDHTIAAISHINSASFLPVNLLSLPRSKAAELLHESRCSGVHLMQIAYYNSNDVQIGSLVQISETHTSPEEKCSRTNLTIRRCRRRSFAPCRS